MKLAKDTKLGGEIILAKEACYERHHDYLRCPECGEMVFWVKGTEYERSGKSIKKSAYFAHHQGDGLECELRVKSYSQERLLSLYSEAKNQRLSILQKHLEMMLLDGFSYTEFIGEDCSKMMPYQIYQKLEKRYAKIKAGSKFMKMKLGEAVSNRQLARIIEVSRSKLHQIVLPSDSELQVWVNSGRIRAKMDSYGIDLILADAISFNRKKTVNEFQSRALNQSIRSDNFYSISGIKNNQKIAKEVLDLLFNSQSMVSIRNRFLPILCYSESFYALLNLENGEEEFFDKLFRIASYDIDWLTLINKYSGKSSEIESKKQRLKTISDDVTFMSNKFEHVKNFTIGHLEQIDGLSFPVDVIACSRLFFALSIGRRFCPIIDNDFSLYLHNTLPDIVKEVRLLHTLDIRGYFLKINRNLPSDKPSWEVISENLKRMFSGSDNEVSDKILMFLTLFDLYRPCIGNPSNIGSIYDMLLWKETIGLISVPEIVLRMAATPLIVGHTFLAEKAYIKRSVVYKLLFEGYSFFSQEKHIAAYPAI